MNRSKQANRLRVPPVLVAVLLVLGALILAYRSTPPIAVSVGELDDLVFREHHELEAAGELRYRWTTETSRVTLPQVGDAGGGALALDVWVDQRRPAVPLTIVARRMPLVTTPIQGQRTIAVLVPAAATRGGDLSFDLGGSIWHADDDARPLGVAIRAARWQGVGTTAPPSRQLWVFPALVILAIGLGSRLGCDLLRATVVVTMAGALLAIGAARWPLLVAPYTHRLALMGGLAHGGLWLWSLLQGADGRRWRLPEEVGPVGLVLLLGVGHWLMVPFQWALCWEVGANVCPRPGMRIIGPVVLAVLAAIAVAPTLPARLRRNIAFGTLAFGALATTFYAVRFALGRSAPDFFVHWRAAFDFHLGRPLYKLDLIEANHFGAVFKLPPFNAMIYLPVAAADYDTVLLGHRLLNLLLYLLAGILLVRFLRPALGWWTATGTVVVIMGLMQPAFDTLAFGQTDIVLLLLLVLILAGLRENRAWMAGAALAMGIIVKLYLLLWAGFLVARRQWSAVVWTALFLVLLNGVAIAVMGWQSHVVFARDVLPNLGGGSSWIENQTINGFLSRFQTGTLSNDPTHDPLIDGVTILAFALIAGSTLLLAIPPTERRGSTAMLQFSGLAIVMSLAVPAAWMHYMTATILVFVALVWTAADRPLNSRQAFAIGLAFSLIAYGNQWSFFDGTRHPGLPEFALSYKGYGLTVLWLVLVLNLARVLDARRLLDVASGWMRDGGGWRQRASTR
jgi:hypothetical protein